MLEMKEGGNMTLIERIKMKVLLKLLFLGMVPSITLTK
jgi:hypothetical protein